MLVGRDMITKRYYIGETLVEVTASDLVQECMRLFCIYEQKCVEGDEVFLKYEIFQVDSVEKITKLSDAYYMSNVKGISFELLNIKYIYLEKEQLYMAISSFCFGIIDIVNKNIIWNVYLERLFPRSLFHMMILDPYSLICPQNNEIIVHGSMMSVGQDSILFLGSSGNGKSTISHRLLKCKGYEKMCDDTFVIAIKNGKTITYPINTGCGYDYEVAKEYVATGDYFELYRVKDKAYILNKNISYSKALTPCLIFFLNREIKETESAVTIIKELPSKEALKLIIDNQTNIGSPFLLKKMKVYKMISESVHGVSVRFVNDCDINAVDIYIKNNRIMYGEN